MNRNEEWHLLEDYLKLRKLNKEIQDVTFFAVDGLNHEESLAVLKMMKILRDDLLRRVKEQLKELK